MRAGSGLPLSERVLPSPFAVTDGGVVVRGLPAVSPGALLPEVAPAGGFFGVADIEEVVGCE